MSTEAEQLDKLPELAATPFPFRGHRDFRSFTESDYADFVHGLFCYTPDERQMKWVGGANRADAAHQKLTEMGYTVTVGKQHKFVSLSFRAIQ